MVQGGKRRKLKNSVNQSKSTFTCTFSVVTCTSARVWSEAALRLVVQVEVDVELGIEPAGNSGLQVEVHGLAGRRRGRVGLHVGAVVPVAPVARAAVEEVADHALEPLLGLGPGDVEGGADQREAAEVEVEALGLVVSLPQRVRAELGVRHLVGRLVAVVAVQPVAPAREVVEVLRVHGDLVH